MQLIHRDKSHAPYFPFGFPMSRGTWDLHGLREIITPMTRRDVRAIVHEVRRFVQRVNVRRAAQTPPAEPLRAGHTLAFGLVSDILRYVVHYYCWQQKPGVLADSLDWTRGRLGDHTVEAPPPAFVNLFPPVAVQVDNVSEDPFLRGNEAGRPNGHTAVVEMLLLRLAAANPAVAPFFDLFDDAELGRRAPYVALAGGIEDFFATQPPLDKIGVPLFEALRAPMRAAPRSLDGQLNFIRANWGHFLPQELLDFLLIIRGILREETAMRGLGPGSTEVLRFGRRQGVDMEGYPEHERFSPDADWMSNVVMIAKSVYVWLDQLTKKYQRPIHRLDDIPDYELERLARWGFNALWLIGLWERSPASEHIKRIMGNPEAVSSAYSLYDYEIAADLGGEEAYSRLRDRARRFGIRLASDMVPNHMGVYSKWVIEHPQWFIQSGHPPYPSYQFTGVNLSREPRVGIHIEDGYWTHRDAAVVFKRIDHWTGDARYIYHGNDGTSMPWNDTAQLNYLLPEVREAVIQTILHVARKFSIIRFDAAMTLAKRHYQRLWFPKPGDAGAIPSRAEHGMSRAEFDAHMPEEFWREVVDRVAKEAPDTLLLAEAFWLMEGYFVRTLGMHRVYNSAFMNMLKMEQNANYRTTVKNVLEFSPEVLKRFVNFMNNPDERTAVEQFGRGDKYIGVCLLMVTMPGLPMFGHGQIEGFSEKYGMEYRRAYWDEQIDEDLVRRHEAEIFPLMRRRYLFSGVEHFAFYDFHTPEGHVDENVLAYSNRAGDQRSIVFYNNAYNTTQGWIRGSSGLNTGCGDEGRIITKSLAESLGLRGDANLFYLFRDHRDGLEYIRSGAQLCDEGLYVHLHAYQYHVFLDFREVYDTDGTWAGLAWHLAGQGAPSIEVARKAIVLAPLLEAFHEFLNPDTLRVLAETPGDKALPKKIWAPIADGLRRFLTKMGEQAQVDIDTDAADRRLQESVAGLRALLKKLAALNLSEPVAAYLVAPLPEPGEPSRTVFWRVPYTTAVLDAVGHALHPTGPQPYGATWTDEWLLTRETARTFVELGRDDGGASMDVRLVKVLLAHPPGAADDEDHWFANIVAGAAAREFLGFTRYEDVTYLNREQLETLLYWMSLMHAAVVLAQPAVPKKGAVTAIESMYAWVHRLLAAADECGYRVDDVVRQITPKAAPSGTPEPAPASTPGGIG